MIECRQLSTGYPGKILTTDGSFFIQKGEIVTLIGPNGCGKTTLLKTLAGLLPAKGGEILLAGRSLTDHSPKELACLRAYLPQSRTVPELTVRALVSHGRFPHQDFSRRSGQADREAVQCAMELTDTLDLQELRLKELSGGQRQRVYLAMSLAQETPLLLWDEPTTYMDVSVKLAILKLIQMLAQAEKTILLTLQDIPDALRIADRVCLLDEHGSIRAFTDPDELFASGLLDSIFHVHVRRIEGANKERFYSITEQVKEQE